MITIHSNHPFLLSPIKAYVLLPHTKPYSTTALLNLYPRSHNLLPMASVIAKPNVSGCICPSSLTMQNPPVSNESVRRISFQKPTLQNFQFRSFTLSPFATLNVEPAPQGRLLPSCYISQISSLLIQRLWMQLHIKITFCSTV